MDTRILQRYIAGEATETEKKLVAGWIQESPDNMCEYMALHKLHDIALWRTEPSVQKVKVVRKKLSVRSLCIEIAKVAAVVVIVLMGAQYWFGKQQPADVSTLQSIYVPAGQRTEITLADGTKVWLNSRSTLTLPSCFSSDIRKVRLDGEGYFVVASNQEKPFIVETNKYNVRVLGTEFNVIAYAEDSLWEASLLEGSIEIIIPGRTTEEVNLEPNTMASLRGNKLIKGHIKETDYFLWREGLLCFNNISVKDMIEKLKLYHGVDIIVNNTRILENRYTGKFRTKDGVEHVLKVLKLNNRFTYTKDDETNVITIN